MSGQDIDAFEQSLGRSLPTYYLSFLQDGQEGIYGEQVLLYGADSLMERNATYDTAQACPGYFTIGDDSG
ncbi:SMI1/KNR4 family protein, partial [Janthinobacterium sp. UMAB-56]|uniref:SMI1/KNR4 family protein n=1 Tax=Janthinobacterium sp. UMAB-56 TaxID=1365361 RepID=UPI001C583C3E